MTRKAYLDGSLALPDNGFRRYDERLERGFQVKAGIQSLEPGSSPWRLCHCKKADKYFRIAISEKEWRDEATYLRGKIASLQSQRHVRNGTLGRCRNDHPED